VLVVAYTRASQADCAPGRTAILSVGGSLVTSARLSVDDFAQGAGNLHQQSRLAHRGDSDTEFTGVHSTVQEDSQESARALRNIGNQVGQRLNVCAVEPTERFDRNWTAILEVADGNQMSLVHVRPYLLRAVGW